MTKKSEAQKSQKGGVKMTALFTLFWGEAN